MRPGQTIVPYDENLLERARTQWQFGDWSSLTKLERDELQHHPERAKLALLAAAGQFQLGAFERAQQFIRLARDWGCSDRLLLQILVAGVHNSLGRFSALAGQEGRSFRHFECAVRIGAPGADTRLLALARAREQLQALKIGGWPQAPLEPLPDAAAKAIAPTAYLVGIKLRINDSPIMKLGFNALQKNWVKIQDDILEYETEGKSPLYLVSNDSVAFDKAPRHAPIFVSSDSRYTLSGEIEHVGENRPVVWVFQYADGEKIESSSMVVENGKFRIDLQTKAATDAVAIGIRLAGKGKLMLRGSAFKLVQRTDDGLIDFFEEKIEKIKQAHKREVENSTKQIEASIRLQHYLGPDVILPDMHNWPISPDFGVLLINLVEQNGYDGVVEFGSGTSTLILAKALDRVARRDGTTSSPLLSFDHLTEYAERTENLLKNARLLERTKVSLAPLAPWQKTGGEVFSYYQCTLALQQYRDALPATATKILVVVDGPPAATGHHARFPALPEILEVFSAGYVFHFLMDDFCTRRGAGNCGTMD